MSVWVFKDIATASACFQEVGVTPGGVWLWQSPAFDDNGNLTGLEAFNKYTPLVGADGRCAMMHSFSEEDEIFMECQWLPGISAGTVKRLEALPNDWVYPKGEV